MKGIIMAGGAGSRLRPLTCKLPKPMVRVVDRPVMQYSVDLLRRGGITDIGVTTQYLPRKIEQYFGSGEKFGVSLRYFEERSPLGTAGSVKNAQEFLDESFLVISGDALCDFDLTAAVRFHRERKADVTLVLARVDTPLDYGVVMTDRQGRVTRFLEKPGWDGVFADTANTGIYLMEPHVLDEIPEGRMFDFSKDLFPKLLARGAKLYGFLADGYWCDIGDVEVYRRANADVLRGATRFPAPAAAPSPVGVTVHGPCCIAPDCEIGEGAVIGPLTVLSAGCRVGAGCVVERSLVGAGCVIGADCELRGAILCDGARLGERVGLQPGAVVGESCAVGDDAVLRENVKIWAGLTLPQGACVRENLVRGGPRACLFEQQCPSGRFGEEITPEFASRLGASFAGVEKGLRLAVQHDGSAACAMLAQSLLAGIRSAGGEALDLESGFDGALRQSVCDLHCDGGVFLAAAAGEIRFSLCDRYGLTLPREWERKIDMAFSREDFERAGLDGLQPAARYSGSVQDYERGLAGLVDPLTGLCCRIECKNTALFKSLVRALSRLGVSIGARGEQAPGFAVGEDGSLTLTDETGRTLSPGERDAALFLAAAARTAEVAAFYQAPVCLDALAHECGVTLRRVLMTPADRGDEAARALMAAQRVYKDAGAGIVVLLDYLHREGKTLSQLRAQLPGRGYAAREVPVDGRRKSAAMRALIESCAGPCELVEGARFQSGDAVVVVVPQRAGRFTVRVEAPDSELAEELCGFYCGELARFAEDGPLDKGGQQG
ncbi:sugar phosphate nucleotidyltransferase [Feifania hominis]|uniref:NTP transferase domain-containing protein n=1 Tax=Feifania hominis TaxID=2763660 RepID=A0A926DEF6_9FIRM|nr:sugar phosphate nucleotidyltransferase [Feifania hominis]MBC8536608.1 NTP transferase domain-containing protein [Feifania hominis]